MKFETQVDELGQVVLPQAVRDHLGLGQNAAVAFEITGATVTLAPSGQASRFGRGIDKWAGSMRAQMLAEGYASTEEWMNDIRDR